ncbi:ABC transporter substrate-binding protein [Halosegnis longus]|uniref:ABC transporter substrate-binding protein n=1 Tax=Halosegnis longus TaxID=2216012 RepID=A0AAJ4UVI8_9EURY|nr:ABC transporter substrate-binding protein [Halosegnis longus]RNJ26061.1 ABC transporter substrate-binding protein [Salella cibi]
MDQTDIVSRRTLLGTGAATAAGLLAGCSGRSSGGTQTDESATDAAEPTATATPEQHSVTMAPVGTVEFDEVPERWVPFTGDYADMGVALGQADGLAGIGVPARYGSHLYEELPGVSVDTDAMTALYSEGTDKETFYSIDADVHVIDPNFAINRLGWSQGDVDELADNVGPFVGNTGFTHVYDWHDDYRYYSMYETLEVLAELFDERARYEAFAAYHDEILADVESRLPEARPDIALLYPAGVPPEGFYPYLVGEGTTSKQWRDLGVGDALAADGITDAQAGGGTIDFETLLDIDPDALAIRLQGEVSETYFDEEIRTPLEEHDVASDLTAVQNDRVIYAGLTYQGPIIHLFQLEAAAQGLYPEEFGGEQLFDRERVADIVTGEFDG